MGTPPIVKVSPNGITAQTRNAGTKISSGASRNTNFSAFAGTRSSLTNSLKHVGDRLQQAARPDPVGAEADLHVGEDLALGEGQVGDDAAAARRG